MIHKFTTKVPNMSMGTMTSFSEMPCWLDCSRFASVIETKEGTLITIADIAAASIEVTDNVQDVISAWKKSCPEKFGA